MLTLVILLTGAYYARQNGVTFSDAGVFIRQILQSPYAHFRYASDLVKERAAQVVKHYIGKQ